MEKTSALAKASTLTVLMDQPSPRLCTVPTCKVSVQITNALEAWRWDTWFTKEPETICWIRNRLLPGMLFVDVGANVGVFSLWAGMIQQRQGEKPHILAVEPNHSNYRSLRCNLHDNLVNANHDPFWWRRIDMVQGAVQSRKDAVDMEFRAIAGYSEEGGPIGKQFASLYREAPLLTHSVNAAPLEDLVKQYDRLIKQYDREEEPLPILLKIDVAPGQALDALRSIGNAAPRVQGMLIEVNSYREHELVCALAHRVVGLVSDRACMAHPHHSTARRQQENNPARNLIFMRS